MKELVSIITPLYNASRFINDCIKSVLKQTYENWEMIIVDDKSEDNSIEIVKEFIYQDNRIKLIELVENVGPGLARNEAIKLAKGRYIAFLDADDLWMPEKLEKQLNFMNKKELVLSYSSYNLINEDNEDLGVFHTKPSVTYNELLKTNCIGCLTAIYDTKLLGKMYLNKVIKRQDYVLWLSILKKFNHAEGLLDPLATYRIRKESVSSNKIVAAKWVWHVYRKVEKFNFIKSCYYFSCYSYNGLMKYK